MEYDKIKQLMEDMSNSNLSAIEIDFPDGTKVSMKKEVSNKVITTNNPEEKTESMDTTEVIEKKDKKRKYSKISNGWNILFKTITNIRSIC